MNTTIVLPQHKALIEASGISTEVSLERGYRSIETKSALQVLGFGRGQGSVPALLLPLHGVRGEIVGYQIRPDTPRQGRDGRLVKYETPAGAAVTLDIHPRMRAAVGNPDLPLVITEGVRKGDAAASLGICCIALIGVWSWRGSNEFGGKTALADWEYVALKGRRVLVAFDSDVTTKPAVFSALKRLKTFLEARGAKVEIVHLPAGSDESKCGLDDYLVQGKTYDDLVKLARPDLPPDPAQDRVPVAEEEYRVVHDGLAFVDYDRHGVERLRRLTNFKATISANITEDDGQEQTRRFEVLVEREGVQRVVRVAASEFPALNWVNEKLGAEFVVAAGLGLRDHARAAIQSVSGSVPQCRVYTHTGWTKLGGEGGGLGQWGYLHAGGAICGAGVHAPVEVQLPPALESFVLPEPPTGDALRAAIRASLGILALTKLEVTAPLLAAIYRAPLGTCSFSVYLDGKTGAGKTELAARCQQHFGATMDACALPGSWSSTGNSLEGTAYFAKDTLLAVDDFVPQGGSVDVGRQHRDADRVLRAQGNRSGRQRMRADGSIRPARAPRGLILSTGEDVPAGHSLRARMFVVEIRGSNMNWEALTTCQKAGREGLFAASMAAYIAGLVPQRDGLEERIRVRAAELRTSLASKVGNSHKRTPDIAAQLWIGIEYFLEFAYQHAAINASELAEHTERLLVAIVDCADEQVAVQAQSDPVELFLRLLRSAVTAGEAHVAAPDGREPTAAIAEALGWRAGSGSSELRPHGERIGWIDGDDLYLVGPTAYRAAQKFSSDAERLTLTQHALGRHLNEAGLLLGTSSDRRRLTVRRFFGRARVDVLHLRASVLLESPHCSQVPPRRPESPERADSSGAVARTGEPPDCDRSAWVSLDDDRGAL